MSQSRGIVDTIANITMVSSNPKTVLFDVGGTTYRASRSLIELWPNTMLARLISEDWNSDASTDVDKEIFIDRDGEAFRYVLNYLRDNKAYLPMTVAKEAVIQELMYYGFDSSAAAKTIHGGSPYLELAKLADTYGNETRLMRDSIQQLHGEITVEKYKKNFGKKVEELIETMKRLDSTGRRAISEMD
jgi:hypothetical protein